MCSWVEFSSLLQVSRAFSTHSSIDILNNWVNLTKSLPIPRIADDSFSVLQWRISAPIHILSGYIVVPGHHKSMHMSTAVCITMSNCHAEVFSAHIPANSPTRRWHKYWHHWCLMAIFPTYQQHIVTGWNQDYALQVCLEEEILLLSTIRSASAICWSFWFVNISYSVMRRTLGRL